LGTLQPSAANALRKPSSLNCDRIDQVSGIATPGSASPTFRFDHTTALASLTSRRLRRPRARWGRTGSAVTERACNT
jgi:hypothetical protein